MAKITDLLRAGPTLSFEFSAPRDEDGVRRRNRTLDRLARLQPSFMSMTYRAGGSSRGPTAEIVHHIQHDLGVTAMPGRRCAAPPASNGGPRAAATCHNATHSGALPPNPLRPSRPAPKGP